MATDAVDYAYKHLKEHQKNLHGIHENPDERDEARTSIFYRKQNSTTWYSTYTMKMETSNGSEGLITAFVNNKFHLLLYNYMRRRIRSVKVMDKYRDQIQICWCHNLGTNMVPKASMNFDSTPVQTIDPVWFDMYGQLFIKPGCRDHHDMCVGNVPFLEEWGTVLPEYTTNVVHPFFNANDPGRAIPIFYFGDTKITFKYTMRNQISELLRMRHRKKTEEEKFDASGKKVTEIVYGEWTEIPFIADVLENVKPDEILDPPEIWARYAYLSPHELDSMMGCEMWEEYYDGVDDNKVPKVRPKPRVIYYEDIISADSINPVKYNASETIKLSCLAPAKGLFWVAENIEATNNRNYSNYTTNKDNFRKGFNPMTHMSLHLPGVDMIPKMHSDHFDKIEPQMHFRTVPSEPGYNVRVITYDPASPNYGVGIVMDPSIVSMTVDLAKSDPFLNIKSNPVEKILNINDIVDKQKPHVNDESKFTIRVRLLVTRKIVISGKDRGGFAIEILNS